jgi:hypothetical protein
MPAGELWVTSQASQPGMWPGLAGEPLVIWEAPAVVAASGARP